MLRNSGAPTDPPIEDIGESFTESDILRSGPIVNILSNGKLVTAVTAAGAGCTACDGVLLNRWRPDPSREADGYFIYVRDLETGRYWSTSLQPDCMRPDEYTARFDAGRVSLERLQDGIRTHLDIYVSTDVDADVRRLTIRNESARARHIDVTSFMEILLREGGTGGAQAELTGARLDAGFDAETESITVSGAPDEAGRSQTLIHAVTGDGDAAGFSVSRRSFVGRGRNSFAPAGMDAGAVLEETSGSTKDPVAVLRRSVRLAPGAEASLTFVLGFTRSRSEGIRLIDHFRNGQSNGDDLTAAAAREVERLLMLKIEPRQARYFRRLGAALYYDDSRFRAPAELVARLSQPIDRLKNYDLVPGRPLVVARIASQEDLRLERTLLKAHRYWLSLGLSVDLFFLNDKSETEAAEELQSLIERTAAEFKAPVFVRGGVYSEYADDMPPEDQILIQSAANILIRESFPRLEEDQHDDRLSAGGRTRYRSAASDGATKEIRDPLTASSDEPEGNLQIRHDTSGRLVLPDEPNQNVIRNARLGAIVSERGPGHTWYETEHQMISRPPDDPISDTPGEAIYLRDEVEGTFWSLFAGPTPAPVEYDVRHDRRSTSAAHTYAELKSQVEVFLAGELPVKLIRVDLANISDRAKAYSLIYYLEPVLGDDAFTSSRYVTTEWDRGNRALVLRNEASRAFNGKWIFVAVRGNDGTPHYSGSRAFFLGRCGDISRPQALTEHEELDGSTGAAQDACAALQWRVEVPAGGERRSVVIVGVAENRKELKNLLSSAEQEAA